MKYRPMTIDIKDIARFCFCPRAYDIRHSQDYIKTLNDVYDESMHNTLYQCLYALQNDRLKYSLDFLKTEWGKEWIKTTKGSELVLATSAKNKDYYNSLRITGIESILKFDKNILSVPQFPVVIDEPYEISVGCGITVTGKFEYIREIETLEGRKIQLARLVTKTNQYYTKIQMENDLELIGAGIAFRERFANDVELIYIDIMSSKVISSMLTEERVQTFVRTVRSVADCLRHNIRCVSHDCKCYHCEHRLQCVSVKLKGDKICLQ